MSLVAAYSDSDSESESEDENQINTLSDSNKTGLVTNECESSPLNDEREVPSSSTLDIADDLGVSEKSNLFSILPQPKTKTTDVVEETDDEFIKKGDTDKIPVEENITVKPFKSSLLNLPTPKKAEKKQPVKILIPSLAEIGADSDSDDEVSKEKEIQSVKQKSTLFAMLPKPKHSATVGANRNKVFSYEANRPLIPHTLTKKKEISIKSQPKEEEVKKPVSLVADFSGSDEDDDDNIDSSSNFFSLGGSKVNTLDIPIANPALSSDVEISTRQEERNSKNVDNTKDIERNLQNEEKKSPNNKKIPDNNNTTKTNSFFSNLYKSDSNIKTENVDLKIAKKTDSLINTEKGTSEKLTKNEVTASYCNSPLIDKSKKSSNVTEPYSDVTAPYSDVTAPYSDVTAPYSDVTAPYSNVTAPYADVISPYVNNSSYRNLVDKSQGITANNEKSYPKSHFFTSAYQQNTPSQHSLKEIQENSEIDYYNKPNEDVPIDKEALRALQGNMRRKEDINFIDIHADDIQANHNHYLKNLTTESVERQMLKAQKDKDQPTSGQKRKHQITYLAFQAKERELQLQQAWAESHATKRQTQSKYGF